MPIALKRPKLTDEQAAALAAHDRSVSLAAGAGCGKTFVLTERFLSYLDPRVLEPIAELHELVAITFTDAAAREMRSRIRKRCYERLTEATNLEEQQSWRRLMRSLDAARISTIHSFCGAILRSHAVEAKLDPQFQVLDQASADLLRLRSLDERLRQLLIERSEDVIQLATRFGLRNLREQLVMLLGENLDPVVEKWHTATPDQLALTWRKHFEKKATPNLIKEFLRSEPILTVRELISSAAVASPELSGLFDRLESIFSSLQTAEHPTVLLKELKELARVQGGPARKKNWVDEADFERFKNACTKIRDCLTKHILLRPWNDELIHEAARTGLQLLQLAADIARCHEQAKQERNVLEFDDLLRKTHQLLTDSEFKKIQRELAQSTRLLLVDEFQDTDPAQVEIVQAFCGEGWQEQGLFVVGDFKQSIYRFRGAEPEVSRAFRGELPKESQLSLTTNFRSQGAILDFVNALFCDSFDRDFEPLHASRPQLTPTPSIEFLWATADPTQPDDSIPAQLKGVERQRYLEARFIARRLAELIDSQEPMIVDASSKKLRPLQPGDIAILLRSLSDVQIYEAALRELGLEYYLAGGHAFYAQQEIHDVLHLLRSIVSVVDDLSLAGALRSPMFALTDETLFWLVNHAGSLNAALEAETLPDELDDLERSKVLRAASILTELREMQRSALVAELLNRAIELTGYDAVLLTEFLGQRKLANLHKLVEQARTLDRLNPGDVSGFVTQLNEFVTRAPKEPVAATSANGDVIRIMTIHNAKGLEFPLVVVPDLNRKSHPGSSDPVMDVELGPLVPSIDRGAACVGWDMYQIREREEDQNEKIRLLYVACTRAADYLILSSSLRDPDKPESDWLKFLGERFDLVSGAFRAVLPPGINEPQIRVTLTEPPATRESASRTHGADLAKLVAKTMEMASEGRGVLPAEVAIIAPQVGSRRRFSFSRLSGELSLDHVESTTEHLTEQTASLDPLGFGSYVHALLERTSNDAANISETAKTLALTFLSDDSSPIVDTAVEMVERFRASPRGHALATANGIHRELEFLLPWPLADDAEAIRYLHGFIDCLYQDGEGEWHLLDYKSNQVTTEGVPTAARHYEIQMYVYTLACERTLGKRPKEAVLHFLRPGCEHSFSWSMAHEAELKKELERAMLALLSPTPVRP